MTMRAFAARLDRAGWLHIVGGLLSLAVAISLYTRYSIYGDLSRDEAIYAYGGQAMTHNVAPYASIFDPKAPLGTMLCGLGAAVGRLLGRDQLLVIRFEFFVFAVLSVLALYQLVVRLWNSVLAGVVAAVVFASFQGYARDALSGPDAKTPGIFFVITSMWLLVRRNYVAAALLGSLGFLVWQPFIIYPIIPVVAAIAWSPDARLRAFGRTAVAAVAPVAITFIYFAAAGQLSKFIESAFIYPLTGVRRPHETVGGRLRLIVDVVSGDYRFSGYLLWVGLALMIWVAAVTIVRNRRDRHHPVDDPLLLVVAEPLVLVVVVTLLFEYGYATKDFQGYPDVFPLLPYPAIGFGGAVALAIGYLRGERARRLVSGVVATAAVALIVLSAVWFSDSAANNTKLRIQQAAACALNRLVRPHTSLYSLGNPAPLVLTHRRNPDRFIYLGSGVDVWKVRHTAGGFLGWAAEVAASRPSLIVVDGWPGTYKAAMMSWLTFQGYQRGYVGKWRVYLTPPAQRHAPLVDVGITRLPTNWPQTPDGAKFTARTDCRWAAESHP